MPKVTAARIALTALIALTLTGCSGAAEEPASEPRSFAQSTPTDTEDAAVAETPTPAASTGASSADDAGYLAEVDRRTRPGTILDQFSDTELIAMGHEGCEQIGAGVPLEDLRLVEGEQATEYGTWQDTSAVFNSALLNYCTELIEEVP
ncbi:hypothetical protein [Microbacterium aerolatum]|uniref:hypothetical protein n=1 Tax=Microbacterium aerolatum TaxID=153731 RepID=UPI0038514B27